MVDAVPGRWGLGWLGLVCWWWGFALWVVVWVVWCGVLSGWELLGFLKSRCEWFLGVVVAWTVPVTVCCWTMVAERKGVRRDRRAVWWPTRFGCRAGRWKVGRAGRLAVVARV